MLRSSMFFKPWTIAGLTAVLASLGCSAQSPAPEPERRATTSPDPYQWLEEIAGTRSQQWVREQNARTRAGFMQAPLFREIEQGIGMALNADASVASVDMIGDHYYRLLADEAHPRGVWQRTTSGDNAEDASAIWEPVIDLDALNKDEDKSWVWQGAQCVDPENDRCLITLSEGGTDASVTREFDLKALSWVKGGFDRPLSKGEVSWIDHDTVYVSTDFGPGSMTVSGYPRIVKRWKRGTPMAQATTVFEAEPGDMMVSASHDGSPYDVIERVITAAERETYLRHTDGRITRLDVPMSADVAVRAGWVVLKLAAAWQAEEAQWPSGSLIAARVDALLAGKRRFTTLFKPDGHSSLTGFVWTKSFMVLNVLEDVKSRLIVLEPQSGEWKRSALHNLPAGITLTVDAMDGDASDDVFVSGSDFLTPITVSMARIGSPLEVAERMPAAFDASRDVIEQHFAISRDGTRIPYFLVRPVDVAFDGGNATLMEGYGGFGEPMLAQYSAAVGKGWLEKGGVYVLANIRGGGEYGPAWHQAAVKANRHKAYEDFAAVAQDLIARKVTRASRLGVMGSSNGGLLAGNMLVQYPQLFGAVVVKVPLLDMKRYPHLLAGPLWLDEYGDPDSADWEYIRTFSPYHLFDPALDYPPVLFTTSTRDDRVHPGHARKMAARMLDAGKDVHFYETPEGGHSGAADNGQSALLDALVFAFLWSKLGR